MEVTSARVDEYREIGGAAAAEVGVVELFGQDDVEKAGEPDKHPFPGRGARCTSAKAAVSVCWWSEDDQPPYPLPGSPRVTDGFCTTTPSPSPPLADTTGLVPASDHGIGVLEPLLPPRYVPIRSEATHFADWSMVIVENSLC